MEKVRYTKSKHILFQRDISIPFDKSIVDSIQMNGLPNGGSDHEIMTISFRGRLLGLNLTSAIIFEALDVYNDIDSLLEYLSLVFVGVNETELKQDIENTISTLIENGLVCEAT